MKKLLIIFLFVPFISVEAKTYYTDYYLVEENSKEYKEETDVLKREEYKLYNTYETEINELGYEVSGCKKYDKSKYIEEELLSTNQINNNSVLYQSFERKDTSLFRAMNIRNMNSDITIKELIITDSVNNYEYIVIDSIHKDITNIYDNDLNTEVTINKGETFTIHSKNLQSLKNLRIEIISDKPFEADVLWYILIDEKMNYIKSNIKANIIDFIKREELEKVANVSGYYDNSNLVKPYYKSNIKKYMCYEEIIRPLGIYVPSGKNINTEDYEIRYNYYKRDYIELSDEPLIKKCNLKSLINDTSLNINDLEIESNIDFNKSGNYQIDYIFKDNIFYHKIRYEKQNQIKTTSSTFTTNDLTTKKISENKPIKKDNCICKERIVYKKNSINYILIIFSSLLMFISVKKKRINN